MDHLEAAVGRLDRALARLEAAAEQRQQRHDRERDGLAQALQTARSEQARTQAAGEGVSDRLESAIERLNAVLER